MLKILSANTEFQLSYAAVAIVVNGLQCYAVFICLTNEKLPAGNLFLADYDLGGIKRIAVFDFSNSWTIVQYARFLAAEQVRPGGITQYGLQALAFAFNGCYPVQ